MSIDVVTLEGDETSFTRLVREHGDAVFGLVLRRTGDRERAADLAQETFLRAWRARASRTGTNPRGWLLAIAANVVRDDARRRRRRPEDPGDLPDIPSSVGDPEVRTVAAESLVRLRAALAALPEAHREMFLLRERDGLSYAEIAAVMRCPIGSVMSGLARARERLLTAVES